MRNTPNRRRVLLACPSFSEACQRGVARFAAEHDWHLVADMLYLGEFPAGWEGDGIILSTYTNPQLEEQILRSATPCVRVALSEGAPSIASVRPDDVAIGQAAADHLLQRAFRNYAFVPYLDTVAQRTRQKAFIDRLNDYGRSCELLPAMHTRRQGHSNDSWGEYKKVLSAALRSLPKPVAIFAGNDCIAAEIAELCKSENISVPDEVSILGVGNDSVICENARTPISSIEINVEELAYQASKLLCRLMEGSAAPENHETVACTNLIARQSTDFWAVSKPTVAAALTYIAENYGEPTLSVVDIARAAGTSRRQLERDIKGVTGLTINDHIVKRRMQEASRLLRDHPRVKIEAIAKIVGYESPRNFFRNFRAAFGESPDLFRKRERPAANARAAAELISA